MCVAIWTWLEMKLKASKHTKHTFKLMNSKAAWLRNWYLVWERSNARTDVCALATTRNWSGKWLSATSTWLQCVFQKNVVQLKMLQDWKSSFDKKRNFCSNAVHGTEHWQDWVTGAKSTRWSEILDLLRKICKSFFVWGFTGSGRGCSYFDGFFPFFSVFRPLAAFQNTLITIFHFKESRKTTKSQEQKK